MPDTPVVTNLAVAAAARAILSAQNASEDAPERAEATLLARVALEAGASEIIAADRERIRQQAPVCAPLAPPNVLCMTCFRPMCRSCGACECQDYSESLCHA
jgi:hypothetical protein